MAGHGLGHALDPRAISTGLGYNDPWDYHDGSVEEVHGIALKLAVAEGALGIWELSIEGVGWGQSQRGGSGRRMEGEGSMGGGRGGA